MFSGVWCSMPTIDEPSTRIPFSRSSRVSFTVSEPFNFEYPDSGDSSPIQIHEIPNSISSAIEYLLMAFADEKTYNSQLLRASFIQSRSSIARFFCSRKFSSIMKNARKRKRSSAFSKASKTSLPVFRKLMNLPLPPKNADVVQKLQPIGQPTDGMIVAAVEPIRFGSLSPITRCPKPDAISGCFTGCAGS